MILTEIIQPIISDIIKPLIGEGEAAPPTGDWILKTGFWDDLGVWDDSDVWND